MDHLTEGSHLMIPRKTKKDIFIFIFYFSLSEIGPSVHEESTEKEQ